MIDQENAFDINIRDYLRIIFKYKWLIAGCVVFCVLFTAIYSFRQVPMYSATVKISIEPQAPTIVNFQDVVSLGQTRWDYLEFLKTQCEIIKSTTVVKRAYNDLKLWDKHKDSKYLKDLSKRMLANNKSGLSESEIMGQIKDIDFYRSTGGISINNVKGTRIVEITKKDKNPDDAALIANGIAEAYIEENLKLKLDSTEDAGNWLIKQIKNQRKRLQKAEIALQKYIERNNIISVENFSDLDKDDTGRRLIANLRSKQAMLEADKVTLSSRYKEKHPKMIRLQAEIDALSKKLGEEMQNNYKLNEKSIKYTILQREVAVNKKMLDSLLQRAKETNITVELKTNNVRIVTPAKIPKRPVSPRPFRNIILALFFSSFAGIVAVFFIESLNDTIKTPDDIKQHTRLQILGSIPDSGKIEDSIDLIALKTPKSIISEAFRTVRTAVNFSLFDSPRKSFLITSPGPSEGKTVCAVNLAISLAQANHKVLLVDTDMRKPRINKVFNLPNENGLSNVLIEKAQLNDVILPTEAPNLFLLPCGPIPPNPAELLDSAGMRHIAERLKIAYDIVIFDSPPMMVVTDALILASMVEGCVLIVRYNTTKIRQVIMAKQRLDEYRYKIFGTINNKLNIKEGSYYYYPYYEYYSQYGEEEKKVAVG